VFGVLVEDFKRRGYFYFTFFPVLFYFLFIGSKVFGSRSEQTNEI
jgi:hypothetical protein